MTKRQLMAAGLWGAMVVTPLAGGPIARGEFLLVSRDHQVRPITPVEINDRALIHGDSARGWVSVSLDQCVALLNVDQVMTGPGKGLLRLSDGQRFPGEALSGARAADDVLVWNQASWLGRMEVPLDRVESVLFRAGAPLLPPADSDQLLLSNGDRLEGFVTALGDPISIEVEQDGPPQLIDIPLDRAASVRMVAPRHEAQGRRLWLIDGTVVDVDRVTLGDDGIVRLTGLPLVVDRDPKQLALSSMVAVQFDTEGLIPFASLEPRKVAGPTTRYVVPEPQTLDDLAALGLARVALNGPVTVHYELPTSPVFLSAEARLPLTARTWGDCELIIRDDAAVVFSTRLTAQNPVAPIGVTLSGSEVTIEVTEGSNGPIQDYVVLHRAMLLTR